MALKILNRAYVENKFDSIQEEINVLCQLDHPNIIKLFETYEDVRNIYLVMELCEGGELFDRIIDTGHYSENSARRCFS